MYSFRIWSIKHMNNVRPSTDMTSYWSSFVSRTKNNSKFLSKSWNSGNCERRFRPHIFKDPTEKSVLTLVEVLVERCLYSLELFWVWEFIWVWWSSLSLTLLLRTKFKSLELWVPLPPPPTHTHTNPGFLVHWVGGNLHPSRSEILGFA